MHVDVKDANCDS